MKDIEYIKMVLGTVYEKITDWSFVLPRTGTIVDGRVVTPLLLQVVFWVSLAIAVYYFFRWLKKEAFE